MKQMNELIVNRLLSIDMTKLDDRVEYYGYRQRRYCRNLICLYIKEIGSFAAVWLRDLRSGKLDDDRINILGPKDGVRKLFRLIDGLPVRETALVRLYGLEDYEKDRPYSSISLFLKQKNVYYDEASDLYVLKYALEYLRSPGLEQLMKSGYEDIVYDYFKRLDAYMEDEPVFDLTGRDMKTITGLKEHEWKAIRGRISRYMSFRYLKGLLTAYDVSEKELCRIIDIIADEEKEGRMSQLADYLKDILDQEYHGEKLYSLSSLLGYLDKCYLEQGYFSRGKILRDLRDYDQMCIEMDLYPNIRPSNLTRDHRLIVKQYNQVKDEIKSKKYKADFDRRYGRLKELEYTGKRLRVIAAKKPQDLIAEGKNNHNCVGSYVERHAEGSSNIFFIRRNDAPKLSYITLELDKSLSSVKQAYYRYNEPIDHRDQQFIDEWLEKIVRKEALQ